MKLTAIYVYEKQESAEALMNGQNMQKETLQIIPVKGHLTESGENQVLEHLSESEGDYLTVLYEKDNLSADEYR